MSNACDPKCTELARHFLGTNAAESQVRELAASIQEAVEAWIYTAGLRALERIK